MHERSVPASPLRAVAALLGATAIMLGALNLLLAWHGGYDATELPGLLILIGIGLWTTSRVGRAAQSKVHLKR